MTISKKEQDVKTHQQQLVEALHKLFGSKPSLVVFVDGLKSLPEDKYVSRVSVCSFVCSFSCFVFLRKKWGGGMKTFLITISCAMQGATEGESLREAGDSTSMSFVLSKR